MCVPNRGTFKNLPPHYHPSNAPSPPTTTMALIPIARHSVLRASRSQLHPSSPLNRSQLSALRRLISTLAILEQRDGKLENASLSAVTAAQKLGGDITSLVAGSGVKPVAEEAAKVEGVAKVLVVENGDYDKVGCLLQFRQGYQ
jgi:electron transfer flavoprotein alpha subunit